MHAGVPSSPPSDRSPGRLTVSPTAPAPTLRDLAGVQPNARVTIVRMGGLGDTILVLPTFKILRLAHAEATFTLVGSVWAEALQPLLPVAARTIHVDRVFPPSRHGGEGADLFAASHAVIVYTAAPESDLVAHVRCVCRGRIVIWPVTPPGKCHAAQHLARAVAAVPSDLDWLPRPTLVCPHELRLEGREWLDRQFGRGIRPVAVHPGSGGRWKCWPAHRFAELASRLDAAVLLIDGPADAAACQEFTEGLSGSVPVVRAADESLSRVAALLMESRGYIGNDSGVSHLAAALGMPTVAVFGPTDPAVWAPLGPRALAVAPTHHDAWPTVDEVYTVTRRLFDERTPRTRA